MSSTPGEQLLEKLEEIRLRLGRSGVERTAGLGNALGTDCGYYKKSMKKFLDQDYVDIRNLFKQAGDLFDLIEGKISNE